MGPNSKRNQQKNAILNNVPARARFSNWIPSQPKGKGVDYKGKDVDKGKMNIKSNHQKINKTLIEEKVIEMKQSEMKVNDDDQIPSFLEILIKSGTIDRIDISPTLSNHITNVLKTVSLKIESDKEQIIGISEQTNITLDTYANDKEPTQNEVPLEFNKKCSISMPPRLSAFEREAIKAFQSLGFYENEIYGVLQSNNKKIGEEELYLSLLVYIFDHELFLKYFKSVDSYKDLSKQQEESLGDILLEEESVLGAIYTSICIRHVALNGIICSIMDLSINANSSIRIFITHIDLYPTLSSKFFGWLVKHEESGLRQISFEAMRFINDLRKGDSVSPLCFEFIQYIQSQNEDKVIKLPQPKKVEAIKDIKVEKIQPLPPAPPPAPNPEILKIPEYRNALLMALNKGLAGQAARDFALEEYKYQLPQRIIDEIRIEEERQEMERAVAFDINKFGIKGEIEVTKNVMEMADLPKAKAKALVLESIKRLEEVNNGLFAPDYSSMAKKIIDQCMIIYRIRLDKMEKRQEQRSKKVKRGLTLRQAFEIVTETKNNNNYPRVKPLIDNNDNNCDEDYDDDYDDNEDDNDDDMKTSECLAELRLKLKEREDLNMDISHKEINKSSINEALKTDLNAKRKSKRYKAFLKKRMELPTCAMKEEVLRCINEHQVTIICGETGSGKTTQIPQLLLDDCIDKNCGAETSIIVTQPRRISAVSVAERISSERCEKVGDSVGYHIRLEKKCSSKTKLLLLTTGVLLRKLLIDYKLSDVSHLIIDEVHERDCQTDFLLIIIKILMQTRSDLKIVLMSATINADLFLNYFAEENCGFINIPGRLFSVTHYFLEDCIEQTGFRIDKNIKKSNFNSSKSTEEIKNSRIQRSKSLQRLSSNYSEQTIRTIESLTEEDLNIELIKLLVIRIVHDISHNVSSRKDAILIFCSGLEAIKDIVEALKTCQQLGEHVVVLPLHSSLSSSDQSKVFEVIEDKFKIVVATNIAETSITIEDVVYVIDTCRIKENRYDSQIKMSILEEKWCSIANQGQRRGRAGRVKNGVCYSLISKYTYENVLPSYQSPEIIRLSLEEVCLNILALNYGNPYHFLRCGITVPSTLAIKSALSYLEELDAVSLSESNPKITPLGISLAALPVEPTIGILLFYGVVLKCIEPVLSIAALLNSKIFVTPFDNKDAANEARRHFNIDHSDILTSLNAFNQYLKVKSTGNYRNIQTFCRVNFLNQNALQLVEQLRKQYLETLLEIGMISEKLTLESLNESIHNKNGNRNDFVLCAVAKGCSSSILKIPSNSKATKLSEVACQSQEMNLFIHPSCIISDSKIMKASYLVYFDAGKTTKVYAREITIMDSYFILILFAGKIKVFKKNNKSYITVDNWIAFELSSILAVSLLEIRKKIDEIFISKILNSDDNNKSDSILSLVEDLCKIKII